MKHCYLLVWLLLSTCLYAGEVSDNVSDGLKAIQQNDFTTAKELFEKACNEGDAAGCYNLVTMYENGQGVKQDLFKAVQFFEKACDNGYVTGCSILE
ncbi:MAG: tetratricopeptide repeat protein [Sulfurospirillum sp.]